MAATLNSSKLASFRSSQCIYQRVRVSSTTAKCCEPFASASACNALVPTLFFNHCTWTKKPVQQNSLEQHTFIAGIEVNAKASLHKTRSLKGPHVRAAALVSPAPSDTSSGKERHMEYDLEDHSETFTALLHEGMNMYFLST